MLFTYWTHQFLLPLGDELVVCLCYHHYQLPRLTQMFQPSSSVWVFSSIITSSLFSFQPQQIITPLLKIRPIEARQLCYILHPSLNVFGGVTRYSRWAAAYVVLVSVVLHWLKNVWSRWWWWWWYYTYSRCLPVPVAALPCHSSTGNRSLTALTLMSVAVADNTVSSLLWHDLVLVLQLCLWHGGTNNMM